MSITSRIHSIDALRGFIMLTMIFVNDLALIKGDVIPNWMVHFSDRATGSGMTFVDLVFPAFIFIVGMSIPFSIATNIRNGKNFIQIYSHVIKRTISLLLLGLMFANGWPSSEKMGWSAPLWQTLMGSSAIFAFCDIAPKDISVKKQKIWVMITVLLRIMGFMGLTVLAFQYVGKHDNHIITLSSPHLHLEFYLESWGILGSIGWAYFIASIIYLIFGNNRAAILGCMILLMSLFPISKIGFFKEIWLTNYVDMGSTLGTQPAIAVAGMLLSTILITTNTQTIRQRILFTLGFIMACALAAVLLNEFYGISKNQSTPSWALWSCAITASIWLLFYTIYDIKPLDRFSKLFVSAGNNVLLAYLLSAIYFSAMINLGLDHWYRNFGQINLAYGILRALTVSVTLVSCTVILNRIGFRLKL